MFEHQTYEEILERMMGRVTEEQAGLDTRVASLVYSALAPAAVELVNLYIQLDAALDESFADTASRDFLVRRCAERGIQPRPATKAVWMAQMDADPRIGARFSAGEQNFQVVEWLEAGKWRLECEEVGDVGNAPDRTMVPIEYIPGLTEARLTELLIPGVDEEETEQLRTRFLESFSAQAYGGNIADYKALVLAMAGVGGCKVRRAWNGGGTVQVVLVSSVFEVPSETLVREVQETLDPEACQGKGEGLAPIGHVVTVMGAVPVTVDMVTRITCKAGSAWEDVKPFAEQAAEGYFAALRKEWSAGEATVVRISQLETRLLGVPGVEDIAGTALCGKEENLVLGPNELPVRGELDGSISS